MTHRNYGFSQIEPLPLPYTWRRLAFHVAVAGFMLGLSWIVVVL